MSENIEIHFVVVLLALVLQLAYGITGKTRWLRSYFEGGLLIMSKTYPTGRPSNMNLSPGQLQAGIRKATGKSLAFGQVAQNRFGFRKGLLDVGLYRRIDKGFEGLLVWDEETGNLQLRLYLNWLTIGLYVALFAGLLLAALSDLPNSLFSLGSFLLLIQVMDGLFAVAAWLEFRKGSRQVPKLYDDIGSFVSASLSGPARIRPADA